MRAKVAVMKLPEAAAQRPTIWTRYRVRWEFLTRLCGSVPADPEMIVNWLKSRQPTVKPAGARTIQEINDEVLDSLPTASDEPEYSILQFQRHAGALVMRYGTIRAHLKDCARVLSAQYVGRIKGDRAFSTRVINALYLDESKYWVPILRPDGTTVTSSDGFVDKAVHVRGPHGQINALKRIEFVDPPSVMEFTLKVLGKQEVKTVKKSDGTTEQVIVQGQSVPESDLYTLFEYGGTHGYAGERSDGEGRYTYEIERVNVE